MAAYKESFGNFARVLIDNKYFAKVNSYDKNTEFLDSCKVEILKM